MLLGDAAGLIDPFTGEGIGNAMASAKIATKIAKKCFEKNNRLCLGLDVDNNLLENNSLDYMNSYIEDIINATIDLCPIYKVNFSFYERYGSKGYKILEKIPEYINNRAISIADAKRGDIGNSSIYYATVSYTHLTLPTSDLV